jgi:ADP-ribosylglycohydrolase
MLEGKTEDLHKLQKNKAREITDIKESSAIPTPVEKCKGAMLATAIGDALKKHRWFDGKIFPGECSDDTQRTLSVARSVIAGDWEKFLAEKELPFWQRYQRGGGDALLGHSTYTQDYFNAGGNDATMRILPHVIAYTNKPDKPALMLDVIRDTLITHGHPSAFLGATCYAYALDSLLRKETVLEYGELVSTVIEGQDCWGAFPNLDIFENRFGVTDQYLEFDYLQEWDKYRTNMLGQLESIKTSLKKGLMSDDAKVMTDLGCFGTVNGTGDVTALTAIYLASRYAANPELGIKVSALTFNADTDTIASITGGLLGMLNGTKWIPLEWRMVQDYDYLVQISEFLLSDDKKTATKFVQEQEHEKGNLGVAVEKSYSIGSLSENQEILLINKEKSNYTFQGIVTKIDHEKNEASVTSLSDNQKFILNPQTTEKWDIGDVPYEESLKCAKDKVARLKESKIISSEKDASLLSRFSKFENSNVRLLDETVKYAIVGLCGKESITPMVASITSLGAENMKKLRNTKGKDWTVRLEKTANGKIVVKTPKEIVAEREREKTRGLEQTRA